jgi:pimeloyl-ACP methyl ester carboxylesterase
VNGRVAVRDEVVVDGRRLEVVTIPGDPARAAIVLLHEGLGSVTMWRDFPSRLAAGTGRTVSAYSRYGHGASEPLAEAREPGYMHHEAQVVLPALLAAQGLTAPVLFGHSDGGSIALIYAGTHPDGARALVLEAPHVFVEDRTVASIALAKESFATSDLPERLSRYHADARATFRGWNDIWLDPRFRDWNITSYLTGIRVPVLVLQGVDDEYGTSDQINAIAAGVPACETLLLERCGHSPHRSQPDAVLERTAAFLERIT